ncbi:hypothetical protein Tco_1246403 [Tanacetum coccineum]
MSFDKWLDNKYSNHRIVDEAMKRIIYIDRIVSSDEEIQNNGELHYQTGHTTYMDDDPYAVCINKSEGFPLNEQMFEQWLAERFEILDPLEPLTVEGLTDY